MTIGRRDALAMAAAFDATLQPRAAFAAETVVVSRRTSR